MSLEEFLKTTNSRVSIGDKWLIWEEGQGLWVVYVSIYRARNTMCLYSGYNIEEAIEALRTD